MVSSRNLTVKAVVDAVNNVFGSRGLGNQSALVLLDHILLSLGKARDAVNICDRLVWSVGDNFSGGTRVHAWKTKVGTNIGIVHVDDLTSSKVRNIFVVNDGVGSQRKGRSAKGSGGAEEGTTVSLGVESSLCRRLSVGCERGGGAMVMWD